MDEGGENKPKINTAHFPPKDEFFKNVSQMPGLEFEGEIMEIKNPFMSEIQEIHEIPESTNLKYINSEIVFINPLYQGLSQSLLEIAKNKKEEGKIPDNFKGEIYKYLSSPAVNELNEIVYDPQVYAAANTFQKKVINDVVVEDPTLPDYSAAYAKLSAERNKPWKLNPSDIADFYLLADFIQKNTAAGTYNEDTRYMAVMKAQEKVAEIGQRLLMALSFEQLDEYDRWSLIKPGGISSELRDRIRSHSSVSDLLKIEADSKIHPSEINAYLTEFKSQLDEVFASGSDARKKVDSEVMDTSLQILESQQSGPWGKMAILMRGLSDKSISIDQIFKGLGVREADEALISQIEKNRDIFIIDRLINFMHNTGRMSARVTNYYPRAASLLIAHGLPAHSDYLYFYSSFMTSTDSLAKLIENDLKKENKRDMIEDLVTAIKAGMVPREYQYALLLEIQDLRIKEAVQGTSSENLSPTHIYTLLQRISHHDGRSRGRLKKAA